MIDMSGKMMHMHVIYASGKLKAFLDARAKGAPHDLLVKLSEESMAELEAERAKVPAGRSTLDDVVVDFNRARLERR